MEPIIVIDRESGRKEKEKVYGDWAVDLLYGQSWWSRTFGAIFRELTSRWVFFSKLYGWWQSTPWSAAQIAPFIKKYHVNTNEFLDPVDGFTCFNDFFIRKLKPEARPIAGDSDVAIAPADGRYRFISNIAEAGDFTIKGEAFSLATLLDDPELAERYANGSMILARLCPSDYHRFHFPTLSLPMHTRFINGYLYSVNPLSIKKSLQRFCENKRVISELRTEHFGTVQYIEIGATSVGSIVQTSTSHMLQPKGGEKGYFAFGGSALVLLFEQDQIAFSEDLVRLSREGVEIKCLMGQAIGRVATHSDHKS